MTRRESNAAPIPETAGEGGTVGERASVFGTVGERALVPAASEEVEPVTDVPGAAVEGTVWQPATKATESTSPSWDDGRQPPLRVITGRDTTNCLRSCPGTLRRCSPVLERCTKRPIRAVSQAVDRGGVGSACFVGRRTRDTVFRGSASTGSG